MRPPVRMPPRFPRPAGRRPRGGTDKGRSVLAVAGVAAVLAMAAILAHLQGWIGPLAPSDPSDGAKAYAGTIQLAASRANLCRRLTFDNRDAVVRDSGLVRCGPSAVTQGATDAQVGGSNLDQIRAGFLRR